MYGKPDSSNALPRITQWIITTLVAMLLLGAVRSARVELRCGAACQEIVNHGREY